MRDFVKGQSEAVKHSRQLNEKTQRLVKFFDLVGKSQQDTAEFLIELVGVDFELLKTVLDDFAKVENAKRFEIEQSWQHFLIACEANKADLILRLTHEHATLTAKKLGELLNQTQNSTDELTQALLNKPFEMCNDMDIGKFQMCLETHIDYHPPRPAQTAILPPPIISPVSQKPSLIDTLRHQIEALHLPRHEIKHALEQLLNDYRD